ncbi:hypothetical protein EJ08DRAFT_600849, partial [Tothia fuscella]
TGRNRSRSPPMIDRYQPERAPREEGYRQREDGPDRRRRSSPQPPTHIDRYVPGQDAPAPIPGNPLPNPLTLDYQVGFTWFAEWWRVDNFVKEEKERQKTGRRPDRLRGEKESREERTKEREQIQAAYDAYKEKLQVQMARSFVLQHRGEEWFKERYNPEARDKFRRELAEFRQDAYARWSQDMDNGIFDEFTLEGIYKSESNGAGGIIEKEEGETTAANEVLGVADLLPTRGGDIRDEAALQPTLLIKTIAPTVSREKMESFCKEHLGEGEGGFRWLSLSDPNPIKKYHRIGWVMLNSSAEKMEIDEQEEPSHEDAEEGEEVAARSEAGDGAVTVTGARKALEELNGKTIKDEERGDFTCHVGIHEPPSNPRKKALWDLFSAPERIERDLQLAIRLANKLDSELGGGHDGVAKVETRVEKLKEKGWLQPPVNAPAVIKPVKDEDMEDGEEGAIDEDEEGAIDDEVDDEDLLAKKKHLDLLVEYLRRVYNFCLFCVFESDSVHELTRKCPGGHLRRPRSSLTSSAKTAAKASAENQPFPFKKDHGSKEEDPSGSPVDEKKFVKAGTKTYQQLTKAFNWVRTYEDKLMQILEPDSVDLKKIGGKPLEEGLDEELSKYVKQEDEAKYRCKVPDCSKLFKGQVFWKKHVEKRHVEFYEKLKQEVLLVNSYVVDPAHIAPSRSDANSNGHFPLNNHIPAGTPRGFNLGNMPFGGIPGALGNGPPNAMQMAAFLASQGVSNPSWGGNPGDEDRHGAGPRRTNNRYNNNRAPGPYDRSKDNRNARWNTSGRLTPPRGGRPPMGNPRFSDGGNGTLGPREAVQGRAIKSYEDLDAAGGSNGAEAELDY